MLMILYNTDYHDINTQAKICSLGHRIQLMPNVTYVSFGETKFEGVAKLRGAG